LQVSYFFSSPHQLDDAEKEIEELNSDQESVIGAFSEEG